MRLTNDMRATIVRAAVKATFGTRETAQLQDQHAIARLVRDAKMTPTQIKAVESLPKNYFAIGGSITVQLLDADDKQLRYLYIKASDDLRQPHCIANPAQVFGPCKLADKIERWLDAGKELGAEKNAFESQIAGVVAAFGTTDKLLLQWPALKDLMGASFFDEPEKPQLPVAQINVLSAQLDAALALAA